MHILRQCEALSRSSESRIVAEEFASAADLASLRGTRPCRMCALSSLVITLCEKPSGTPVKFTVASQASPHRVDGNPYTSEYRRASDSGAQRIRKLGRRLNWEVTETAIGPVAVGEGSPDAVQFLSDNLRVARLPHDADTNPETIETFWVLAGDNPPEAGGNLNLTDLWRLALAVG